MLGTNYPRQTVKRVVRADPFISVIVLLVKEVRQHPNPLLCPYRVYKEGRLQEQIDIAEDPGIYCQNKKQNKKHNNKTNKF